MAQYTLNEELNGIEISFDRKPDRETLTALKSAGYRWHRVKKVWYAKQTDERLTLAKCITGEIDRGISFEEFSEAYDILKTPAKIDLDDLGKTPVDWHNLSGSIRAELKARHVKGVTVRESHYRSITLTIKADANDFASVEEMSNRCPIGHFSCDLYNGLYTGGRYLTRDIWDKMTEAEQEEAHKTYLVECIRRVDSVNHYRLDARNDYFEFTTAFYNKVKAVFAIANQWNYDNSDPYSDYHDVGYYLHIAIKKDDFTPREAMTEAERAAYKAEIEQEEAERAATYAKYEKEQEEAKKAREAYEAQRKADREVIFDNLSIEDLTEDEQIYISDLSGGIGKECNIDELRNNLKYSHDAVISRKVTMTEDAFEKFGNYLLDDFEFLTDKGGTATEDIRLEKVDNLYSLTKEQRADIKWYMTDCVAIMVNDDIKLVCNPEGYSYSRYTYLLSDTSEIRNAKMELKRQEDESKDKISLESLIPEKKPFSMFA